MTLLTKSIHFTKMHGIGNDFMVIDNHSSVYDLSKLIISSLSNRFTGIGFDQLLVIEPSKDADFFVRIYNADGSEAEQCGNGLRCIARYLHETGLITQSLFSLETKAGRFAVSIKDYNHISVTLGKPNLIEATLSLTLSSGQTIPVTVLDLGNPHAIVLNPDQLALSFDTIAPQISTHSYFKHGTNVGFASIHNRDHISLRTLERGSGETFACGSNASAAVAAGILLGRLDKKVMVEYKLGRLFVEWPNQESPITLSGPASMVYRGELI